MSFDYSRIQDIPSCAVHAVAAAPRKSVRPLAIKTAAADLCDTDDRVRYALVGSAHHGYDGADMRMHGSPAATRRAGCVALK